MKNVVIAQIVLNTRQCPEPALPSPGTAGGREAPAGCTSCSTNRIPRLHLKRVVPWQGHIYHCPFPTATVELPARSGECHTSTGVSHEWWSVSRVM